MFYFVTYFNERRYVPPGQFFPKQMINFQEIVRINLPHVLSRETSTFLSWQTEIVRCLGLCLCVCPSASPEFTLYVPSIQGRGPPFVAAVWILYPRDRDPLDLFPNITQISISPSAHQSHITEDVKDRKFLLNDSVSQSVSK